MTHVRSLFPGGKSDHHRPALQGADPTAESVAWTPHYNISPTKTVVVVGDNGTRYLAQMRWGLISSWAKDPAIGNRMINARAETVATKPAFRIALRKRRCLVVADGFYRFSLDGHVGTVPSRDDTRQPRDHRTPICDVRHRRA